MTSSQWSLFWGNFWVAVAITVACFVVGELTSNVSQVDKLWSILPVLYCSIATVRGDFDARMVLMAVLATVWGVRLTYNFSRQGGYTLRFWSGVEDYRWVHVRSLPVLRTRVGWTLFDLLFICVFQNALLLWITTPIISVHGANRPLGVLDWLLVVIFLAFVAFETYADQTQWLFQSEKKRRKAAGKEPEGRFASGFIHDGIWAATRHPNYTAEQSIWIVFALFAVLASHRLPLTVFGAVVLLALFQGSSRMSESIQLGRYPDYRAYQRRTPRFLPWPKAALLH